MATETAAIRMRDDAHGISPRAPGVVFFVLAAEFMTVIMLAASMAPGYEDAEQLAATKAAPDYWAKSKAKAQSDTAA